MSNRTCNRERIAAIKARCDKATEGPWVNVVRTSCWVIASVGHHSVATLREVTPEEAEEWAWQLRDDEVDEADNANAEFMANTREDVPWLLACIAALEAERDELRVRLAGTVAP